VKKSEKIHFTLSFVFARVCTFNITVYYNDTPIETKSVILAAGAT